MYVSLLNSRQFSPFRFNLVLMGELRKPEIEFFHNGDWFFQWIKTWVATLLLLLTILQLRTTWGWRGGASGNWGGEDSTTLLPLCFFTCDTLNTDCIATEEGRSKRYATKPILSKSKYWPWCFDANFYEILCAIVFFFIDMVAIWDKTRSSVSNVLSLLFWFSTWTIICWADCKFGLDISSLVVK